MEKRNGTIILHEVSLSFLEDGYNVCKLQVPQKNAMPLVVQNIVICLPVSFSGCTGIPLDPVVLFTSNFFV